MLSPLTFINWRTNLGVAPIPNIVNKMLMKMLKINSFSYASKKYNSTSIHKNKESHQKKILCKFMYIIKSKVSETYFLGLQVFQQHAQKINEGQESIEA